MTSSRDFPKRLERPNEGEGERSEAKCKGPLIHSCDGDNERFSDVRAGRHEVSMA